MVGRERGLAVDVHTLRDRSAVPMNDRTTETLRRAARAAGVEARDMTSGAGHDSQEFSPRPRTLACSSSRASVGGPHCADEATAAEDVVLGTRVSGDRAARPGVHGVSSQG